MTAPNWEDEARKLQDCCWCNDDYCDVGCTIDVVTIAKALQRAYDKGREDGRESTGYLDECWNCGYQEGVRDE